MRRLIHIPIIHNAADLGSLSSYVQSIYLKLCGQASWNQREEIVKKLWKNIELLLDKLSLDAPKTRLYQDGLPICGFEDRIVRELAAGGSCNHQLVLKWMNRGAILMGTENSQLLLQEYELQKKCIAQQSTTPVEAMRGELDRLLKARDVFIVERIASTLKSGETGLLFLGALHRPDFSLAGDVQLETLGNGLDETVRRPRA